MDDPSRSSAPPITTDHAHEESDVAIRPLATFLVALVVGLAVVALLTAWMFGAFLATTNTAEDAVPVVTPPEESFTAPELQVSPRRDLQLFRAREARVLSSTEWIDREQGIVRIPVERAIKIVAERGFPDWPKAEVTPPVAGADNPAPVNRVNGGSP
jgi:hypothetical protein